LSIYPSWLRLLPLVGINFKSAENQADDKDLVIGKITGQIAGVLLCEGDITAHQLNVFCKLFEHFASKL